jgi:hypothetical protein
MDRHGFVGGYDTGRSGSLYNQRNLCLCLYFYIFADLFFAGLALAVPAFDLNLRLYFIAASSRNCFSALFGVVHFENTFLVRLL